MQETESDHYSNRMAQNRNKKKTEPNAPKNEKKIK